MTEEQLAALERATGATCLDEGDRALLAELYEELAVVLPVGFTPLPPAVSEGGGKGEGSLALASEPPSACIKADRFPEGETPDIGLQTAGSMEGTLEESVGYVHRHWQRTYGTSRALSPKADAAVRGALVEGISVADCVRWVDFCRTHPDVLKRVLPGLETVFRSLPRVRKHLGLPAPRKVTWLTDYADVFAEFYPDGAFPFGQASKDLRPLEDRHPHEEVVAEFRGYLAQTPLQYVSFRKFAMGFGSWGTKSRLVHSTQPVRAVRS